jgi:hypothetical protein
VFNDAGADVDFRVEGDTDANLLFVDAGNDAVLLGSTTATNNLRLNEKFGVVTVNETFGGAALTSYQGASTSPVILDFNKSRGSTDGSMTVVAVNDQIGAIAFRGSDGSAFVDAATIRCDVDATPGSNDMPGRIVFSTTADGASSVTERARIDSSGNLLVGTTTAPTGAVNSIVPKAVGDGTGGIIGNNILINQFNTPADAGTFTITLTGNNFQGYVDVFVYGTFNATNREGYAAYKVLWNRTTTSVTTITVQAPTNTGGTFTTSYTFTASKPNAGVLTLAIGKPSGAGYGVFLNGQINVLSTISSSFA